MKSFSAYLLGFWTLTDNSLQNKYTVKKRKACDYLKLRDSLRATDNEI